MYFRARYIARPINNAPKLMRAIFSVEHAETKLIKTVGGIQIRIKPAVPTVIFKTLKLPGTSSLA